LVFGSKKLSTTTVPILLQVKLYGL
jgi:hypothetical protein